MLPLSGNNADIGQSILNSFLLAARETDPTATFFIIDTSDKKNTPYYLSEKFKNKKINAIIGPLFAKDAKQYSSLFSGTYMLSFSNDVSINNAHVTACGLSPYEEIKHLTRYAQATNKDGIFALIPNGKYGDTIIDAFKKAYGTDDFDEYNNFQFFRYSSRKIDVEKFTELASSSNKSTIFIVEPIIITQKLPENISVFTLSQVATVKPEKWESAYFAFSKTDLQQKFVEKYLLKFKKTPTTIDMISYEISEFILNTQFGDKEKEGDRCIYDKKHTGCFSNFLINQRKGIVRKLQIFQMKNGKSLEVEQ